MGWKITLTPLPFAYDKASFTQVGQENEVATGNVKGPLGPIMLALLIGVAGFMLYAMQSPEWAGKFTRLQPDVSTIFRKTTIALLFAGAVSLAVIVIKRTFK